MTLQVQVQIRVQTQVQAQVLALTQVLLTTYDDNENKSIPNKSDHNISNHML